MLKSEINRCFIHLVNFEETKEWYKDVLNFEVGHQGEGVLEFVLNGPNLILLQAHVPTITPLPYSVFFFETTDVEKTHQQFKAKGVKVDEIENFGSSMKGFHFYDPEGNRLLACTTEG
ncbi:VOC family protein [Bacillus spongiae]|uniref:VOC family protein n=1 Tax=Bacillus spongiae TaxID=2683610 RepID=A0ABU8HFV9_9BACI